MQLMDANDGCKCAKGWTPTLNVAPQTAGYNDCHIIQYAKIFYNNKRTKEKKKEENSCKQC